MTMQRRRPAHQDQQTSRDAVYYRAAGLILAATLGFLAALFTVCAQ